MRSNVRKMFDGLYMKTETTYRAVQTRKDAKHIVKNMGRVSDELMETYKKKFFLIGKFTMRNHRFTGFSYFPEMEYTQTQNIYRRIYGMERFFRIIVTCFLDVLMKINVCTTCYFQMYVDREQL